MNNANPENHGTAMQTSTAHFRFWRAATILLFLTVMTATLAPRALANTFNAAVDRNTISEQDTLTLTLRYAGQTQASPDFDPLLDDFDILSRSSGSQMRVINNRMESWTEWRLVLYPRRTGELRIPPLTLGSETSNPVVVQVNPASRGATAPDRDFYVELELDADNPYIQQQVLMTVRLVTRVNISGIDMGTPELNNALVLPLGENRFHREIDNVTHGVVEFVYAIYPQRSGELTIPPITLDLQVGRGQRDLWGNLYGARSSLQRLRTQEKTLRVRPVPRDFAGDHWLPAHSLELTENWSGSLDNLSVGEPFTRTVTLRADGLTLGQLPPLPLATPEGVTGYPDQPQTDEQRSESGSRSVRIETLAMVANRDGRIELPEVQVHWWDVKADEPRVATLPARTLRVGAVAGAQAATTDRRDALPLQTQLPGTAPATAHPMVWWWLAGYPLLLAVLLWLAAGYWRQRAELRAIADLYREERSEQRQREAHNWNSIRKTAGEKNLPALRQALIGWGQNHRDNENLRSLDDLARKTDDAELQQQLRALDKALYGSDSTGLDLDVLLRSVDKLRTRKRKEAREQNSLQPLYG